MTSKINVEYLLLLDQNNILIESDMADKSQLDGENEDPLSDHEKRPQKRKSAIDDDDWNMEPGKENLSSTEDEEDYGFSNVQTTNPE